MDRNDEIKKLRDAIFRLEDGEDISLEEAKEIYDIQRNNKDRLDCKSNDFDGRLYGFVHRWYETVRDVLKTEWETSSLLCPSVPKTYYSNRSATK